MNDPVLLILKQSPQGKARPWRNRRQGRTFTAPQTRSYETALQWEAKIAMAGRVLMDGPIEFKVIALMPVPKSWSQKKRAEALMHKINPTSKPDWDNLGKAAADALNGIVYKDDAQIVRGSVEKWYSTEPALHIEIQKVIIGQALELQT
jgi:Holliday junction resolvase RusA-like endonuclease